MNVRFTQIVDYYVGVLLCAVLTIFHWVTSLFLTRKESEIKKVLFIELSEMGSTFLAYPALLKATEKVGVENVYFLIFKSNAESISLLHLLPDENIITIHDKSFLRFCFSTLLSLLKIRSKNIDTTIDLELFSRFTTIVSYLSGATKRVGFSNYTEEGLYRGKLITHEAWYNPFVHISQNFLHLMHILNNQVHTQPWPKEAVPDLPLGVVPEHALSESDLSEMKARIEQELNAPLANKKILLLNPDPGQLPLRGWPVESYVEVVRALDKSEVCFVICGMESSQKFAEKLLELSKPSTSLNFCGKTTSLSELTTLISVADCFLTSDSGPGHMATLTETPTIVLFGPESPNRYRPLGKNVSVQYANLACSPCYTAANHRHSSCSDNVCMQRLSPKKVIDQVRDIFHQTA